MLDLKVILLKLSTKFSEKTDVSEVFEFCKVKWSQLVENIQFQSLILERKNIIGPVAPISLNKFYFFIKEGQILRDF